MLNYDEIKDLNYFIRIRYFMVKELNYNIISI